MLVHPGHAGWEVGNILIELLYNVWLEPDAFVYEVRGLTEAERAAIRHAGETAKAEGKDPAVARFDAIVKTGKIFRVYCGKRAFASIATMCKSN